MLGATVYSGSNKQTVVSVRRADPPTVLPRPQVIVVQGGIKSSGLAAVLSFFWSGLGQVYLGKMGIGIALMLAQPAMTLLGLALTTRGMLFETSDAFVLGVMFLIVATAIWIFGMTNAYRTAELMNQQDLARY
jgi:TM2 domain-containing membrane protein YozV